MADLAVATELAGSDELDELFKLNASESEPEDEDEDEDDEEYEDDDEDDEGIKPEGMPQG
jgi:hypothetical protein